MSREIITEFLEARIAEDEALASEQHDAEYYIEGAWPDGLAARVLAECAAKRAIIAEHELATRSDGVRSLEGCVLCNYNRDYGWEESGPCKTIRALAAIYSNHPDYRQEWAK